ncbi:MAG: amidase [Alphaproteobacteria bacterium]|nr:amidase [Alphaproteobacteria bacterium]
MGFAEYDRTDGLGLAEMVAAGDTTPSELLEEAIARTERLNPALNAVILKDYERARAAAKETLPKGPFAGVPFLLKDISLMSQGLPTRQGSRFFPPFPADHDSFLMTRFRKAGFVAFGKTNAPEFGLLPTTEGRLYGPAHNPWNLDCTTGGSSGGSAAAVAAGIVPLAHANDGGGSIRIPASCCGLVGLKPSRGRISAGPDLGEVVDGLAVDLVVSRTVRDTAAALDVAAGYEPGDPYSAPPTPSSWLAALREKPKRLRIGFAVKRFDGSPLHPDCVAAVEQAARLCAGLGHSVEEASPELDLGMLAPAFLAIWSANLASLIDYIKQMLGQTPGPDNLEGYTLGLYEMGMQVTAAQYLQAKIRMNYVARLMARFHKTYDVWLTSTLGSPPLKLGTLDIDERDPWKAMIPQMAFVPFTAVQNITGQPAINLPLSWNTAGLPIGVQFVAGYGEEASLLRLAAQLEQAQPWFARYATIKLPA